MRRTIFLKQPAAADPGQQQPAKPDKQPKQAKWARDLIPPLRDISVYFGHVCSKPTSVDPARWFKLDRPHRQLILTHTARLLRPLFGHGDDYALWASVCIFSRRTCMEPDWRIRHTAELKVPVMRALLTTTPQDSPAWKFYTQALDDLQHYNEQDIDPLRRSIRREGLKFDLWQTGARAESLGSQASGFNSVALPCDGILPWSRDHDEWM